MNEHSLRILEYGKVIEIVAGYAASDAGRRAVQDTLPENDRIIVEQRLRETGEMMSLLESGEHPPLEGILDISGVVGKLGAAGSVLTPQELLNAASTLAAARRIRYFFKRFEDGSASLSLPLMCSRAVVIRPLKDIEESIAAAVDEQAEVRDSASAELRRIRKHLVRTRDDILARMSSILQDSGFQKVIQEPVITIRDDRYVLPLKPNFRQNLRGVVHGQSGSRATLFVEPLDIVDGNNRLTELRSEEREEVERILRGLTALLARERESIAGTLDALAQIDAVSARARFGIDLQGSVPGMAAGRRLSLRAARHPLLALKQKTGRANNIAPNDLELSNDDRALILSGPNAGGKTVILKTVGLLCLMAQAGLPVTAAEGTELPCFTSIYADIGDEQSIEQDLSTFSSHMSVVAAILREAGPDSLVLLDELGSGTDPAEGAGLGTAVLDRLIERGCLTLATTHHTVLKLFGARTKGARNAAMEFDPATLKPTYRLLLGRPGRSYGLDMASRIGVPEDVIGHARSLVSEDDTRLDSLLKQVEEDAERISAERSALARELQAARLDRSDAAAALQAARTEAREIRDQAKRETRDIVRELRTKLRELSRAEKLELSEQKQQAARIEELNTSLDAIRHEDRPPEPHPDLHPGDRVRIPRWNKPAIVMAAQRGVLHLDVEGKRISLPASDVVPVEPLQKKGHASRMPGWSADLAEREGPADRLNIIGLHVDEGLAEVERFIDQAGLNGLASVTIIHGLGTGALKAAVAEYLRQQPLVTATRPGAPAEGGAGVTVAELKR
ncbi:MAG TPA: endonuclease MutS2 [Nitrospirota bacterium]|nr:endonuclease MutS2 [Nitrospirota bacterium]